MKKTLFSLAIFVLLVMNISHAQLQTVSKNTHSTFKLFKNTPNLFLPAPNLEQIKQEDIDREKAGQLFRIGVAAYTNVSTQNSGLWTNLANGDRLWQLNIQSPGAEALSFLFETFKIYDETQVWVQDKSENFVHKKVGSDEVNESFTQNLALCFGDDLVLCILEPKGSKASEILLDRVMYNYRETGNSVQQKINESDPCQVNVNCSEGNNYQDEKRGVARVYVVEGNQAGWCTGSLVNNLAQDCKPYFLLALHCGVTTSASNMTQWRFYFGYEAVGCNSPNTAGTLDDNFITGCVRLADSGDGGGDSGSDFLLVQLGSLATEATTITKLKSASFNAYWNGWDANTTASSSGVGIHHPSGDIKKISTYSSSLASAGWNGNGLQSHWRVSWVSTANGHGVTEGGSSGSPIFTYNGGNSRIVGTLTGGSSYCTATSSPDYYGKMSYHWTSNGTANNRRLKTYLDPANTGTLILNGSSNPCNGGTPTPTGYCPATSTGTCDEYIQNVTLASINKTSGCDKYANYTTTSTDLTKGQSYSITITPQIVGNTTSFAYTNDEIAAWIDYNNNQVFESNERIAYVLVPASGTWNNQFQFTVPTSAATASTRMRVRISYSVDGAIDPCGNSTYGEVEDYTVVLKTSTASLSENNPLALVNVYPNPTKEELTVDLSSIQTENVSLQLYSIDGKLVRDFGVASASQVKLDVSMLANGAYHLKMKTATASFTQRVIKN